MQLLTKEEHTKIHKEDTRKGHGRRIIKKFVKFVAKNMRLLMQVEINFAPKNVGISLILKHEFAQFAVKSLKFLSMSVQNAVHKNVLHNM